MQQEDLRRWNIRNMPAEIIDAIKSYAYLEKKKVNDLLVEIIEEWRENNADLSYNDDDDGED